MFYVLFGISVAIRGYIQGIGDVNDTTFVGMSSLAVRIAMSYLLRPVLGNKKPYNHCMTMNYQIVIHKLLQKTVEYDKVRKLWIKNKTMSQ